MSVVTASPEVEGNLLHLLINLQESEVEAVDDAASPDVEDD